MMGALKPWLWVYAAQWIRLAIVACAIVWAWPHGGWRTAAHNTEAGIRVEVRDKSHHPGLSIKSVLATPYPSGRHQEVLLVRGFMTLRGEKPIGLPELQLSLVSQEGGVSQMATVGTAPTPDALCANSHAGVPSPSEPQKIDAVEAISPGTDVPFYAVFEPWERSSSPRWLIVEWVPTKT